MSKKRAILSQKPVKQSNQTKVVLLWFLYELLLTFLTSFLIFVHHYVICPCSSLPTVCCDGHFQWCISSVFYSRNFPLKVLFYKDFWEVADDEISSCPITVTFCNNFFIAFYMLSVRDGRILQWNRNRYLAAKGSTMRSEIAVWQDSICH